MKLYVAGFRTRLYEKFKSSASFLGSSRFKVVRIHSLPRMVYHGFIPFGNFKKRTSLSLQHFHPHWHVRRGIVQQQPILEPRPRPGLETSSQPVTSTRRELSGLEKVEVMKKRAPKCSKCHQVGHKMTSKACPLRYSELLPTGSPTSVP